MSPAASTTMRREARVSVNRLTGGGTASGSMPGDGAACGDVTGGVAASRDVPGGGAVAVAAECTTDVTSLIYNDASRRGGL
jgi:hypothetical protein